MATAAKGSKAKPGTMGSGEYSPAKVARLNIEGLSSQAEAMRENIRAGMSEVQFQKFEGARQVLADLGAEVSQGN